MRTKQRNILLFEESIKSKYTKRNYNSHLRQFQKFVSRYTQEDLSEISHQSLQGLLEDYLMELKHTAHPNSIPSKFQGIRHFCVINRINLNWDIIHKMFPQKLKTQSLRSYTTKEVKKILSGTKNVRNRALIHFLASTGARIGVFDHKLLVRHMKRMPYGCCAVKLYAGEMEEYWSFLTPQATRMLDSYHGRRRLDGEAPIFATGAGQLGWNGARSVMYRAISKSGIDRSKQNNRYDVQADHGLRKRFNTVLKLDNSVNYNVAEKLMGHKNGLDGVYLTPTIEELFAEFKTIAHKLEI